MLDYNAHTQEIKKEEIMCVRTKINVKNSIRKKNLTVEDQVLSDQFVELSTHRIDLNTWLLLVQMELV